MTEPLVREHSIAPLLDAFKALAHRVPLALLSVGLALVLWIAVTNEQNPTLRRDLPFLVPVEAVNVPRAFVVSSVNPDKVSVTVIGPRATVTNVQASDVNARLNLATSETAGASSGPLRFSVLPEVGMRQRGVRTESTPALIEVTLEPVVRRSVPVKVEMLDTLPVGFELVDTASSQPAEVTVSGAKENVDLVDAAVASVKLSGLTVNINQSVPLNPRDNAGHSIGRVTVEPASAAIAVRVRQVSFSRQVLVDPRIRGRPAPGYSAGSGRAEPASVTVLGTLDALNQVSSPATQEVDVEGATSDVVRTVALQLPPGVSLSDQKTTIVVRVPIQPLTGPGSIGVAPRVTGIGAGLVAISQTASLAINLSGSLPLLLRLTPADVSATVDVGGLGPGLYRLEPKITLPQGLQLDGVVPDRVTVLVTPATAPR